MKALRCLSVMAAFCALGCGTKPAQDEAPNVNLVREKPAPTLAAGAANPKPVEAQEPTPAGPLCPPGMAYVPGGVFSVGSASPTFEGEENPRFSTRVAAFCADETEVLAHSFAKCVEAGKCTLPHANGKRCTYGTPGKEGHPVNCIDFEQASAVCAFRGARLPSEVEWEYFARGGAEMRRFPWGEAPPDGHACWKHHETCAARSFPQGAFGLWDVTGNVWEWTSSWFAPYPWPRTAGRHRVYRGGSWSRRFDKWMKPTLRNRASPEDSGSHLGVRCVSSIRSEICPYGTGDALMTVRDHDRASCAFGVEGVECGSTLRWNGARCAAPDAPLCPEGSRHSQGRGCVSTGELGVGMHDPGAPARRPDAVAPRELDVSAIARRRSPQFDNDCQGNQPSRPHSYAYEGGEHLARNQVMKRDGCKNRDVGVGWNSGCCP